MSKHRLSKRQREVLETIEFNCRPVQIHTCERDRDADRKRFPDDDFNAWLDVGVSDAGHTVYDSLSSIEDAWRGWHGHVLSVMSDENPVFDDLAIDSPTTAASVSERARAILKSEMGGFGTDTQGRIPLEYALRAIEQALTQIDCDVCGYTYGERSHNDCHLTGADPT